MKIEFKPIEMRCTEQQFNELKPRLDEYGLEVIDGDFNLEIYKYITNFYNGKKNGIGSTYFTIKDREIIENFNADLFLQCCGVKLEETFTLTKSDIIENKDKTLKEMFKGVFEVELEVGKWYKHKELEYIFCFNGCYEHYSQYGFTKRDWSINISSDKYHLHNFIPATEEEVKTALVNEAIKLGLLNEKINISNVINEVIGLITNNPIVEFRVEFNELILRNCVSSDDGLNHEWAIFKNGKWATIIEQKEMTVAEIEKELGYNIKIIK